MNPIKEKLISGNYKFEKALDKLIPCDFSLIVGLKILKSIIIKKCIRLRKFKVHLSEQIRIFILK